VRKWLIDNGFQGKEGQEIPAMNDDWVVEISKRYIELYEQVSGKAFIPAAYAQDPESIMLATEAFLEQL
jgi:phosphoribosylaminoimidazole-succinocarboxamide synthase